MAGLNLLRWTPEPCVHASTIISLSRGMFSISDVLQEGSRFSCVGPLDGLQEVMHKKEEHMLLFFDPYSIPSLRSVVGVM